VALLARHDVPLIEDDVYGDAGHGEDRPAPAKKWDRDGGVILCSSFSKTLAPGYRVGWMAGGRYHADLMRLKLATTLATATAPQLAIAAFLRSSSYSRYVQQVRRTFSDQVARGREAVARAFPHGTRVSQPRGGFVLWVALPDGLDADRLAEAALAAGISITPGSLFSPRDDYRNCFRLSCGRPWSDTLDRAVETLGRLVRRQQRRSTER
jgi:DNA-binding transcriptional MocR family regulator